MEKPDLGTLDIRYPCNYLNPQRMILVSTLPSTILSFEIGVSRRHTLAADPYR